MPTSKLTASLAIRPDNLSQVVAEINSALGRVNPTINVKVGGLQAGQLSASNAQLKALRQNLDDANSGLSRFGELTGLAQRRFLAFAAGAGSIVAVASGIRTAVSEAVAFDRAMNKLGQVSGDSVLQIRAVQDEITRLATAFGVSSRELADGALVFKQAGLSLQDTKLALEALAKAALAPNFDSMKSTAEGAIAVMQQFKLGAKDLEGALGSMNQVAGDFAVEAGDLITAVKKAGGAFASTGGDLNQFMALFTAVRATTRESADEIASGLRTIFTRLQRNDTAEALKQLNVQLRFTREEAEALGRQDLTGQFVGGYEAIKRVSTGLQGVRPTDTRFAQVEEALGGYRQISRVIPLVQQFGEAQKALNSAQAGQISLTVAADKAQDALVVKLTRTKEEFLALGRALVDDKGFRSFADLMLSGASAAAELVKNLTPLLPLLAGLAARSTLKGAASLVGDFSVPQDQQRTLLGGYLRGANPGRRTVGFSVGGQVSGPEGIDVIPAALTRGEYVIKREAAESIGYDRLDRMNREKRVGYALGGRVGYALGGRVGYADGGKIDRTQENRGLVTEVYSELQKVVRNLERTTRGVDVEGVFHDSLMKSLRNFDRSKEAGGGGDPDKVAKFFASYVTRNFKQDVGSVAQREAKRQGVVVPDDVLSRGEARDPLEARESQAHARRVLGGPVDVRFTQEGEVHNQTLQETLKQNGLATSRSREDNLAALRQMALARGGEDEIGVIGGADRSATSPGAIANLVRARKARGAASPDDTVRAALRDAGPAPVPLGDLRKEFSTRHPGVDFDKHVLDLVEAGKVRPWSDDHPERIVANGGVRYNEASAFSSIGPADKAWMAGGRAASGAAPVTPAVVQAVVRQELEAGQAALALPTPTAQAAAGGASPPPHPPAATAAASPSGPDPEKAGQAIVTIIAKKAKDEVVRSGLDAALGLPPGVTPNIRGVGAIHPEVALAVAANHIVGASGLPRSDADRFPAATHLTNVGSGLPGPQTIELAANHIRAGLGGLPGPELARPEVFPLGAGNVHAPSPAELARQAEAERAARLAPLNRRLDVNFGRRHLDEENRFFLNNRAVGGDAYQRDHGVVPTGLYGTYGGRPDVAAGLDFERALAAERQNQLVRARTGVDLSSPRHLDDVVSHRAGELGSRSGLDARLFQDHAAATVQQELARNVSAQLHDLGVDKRALPGAALSVLGQGGPVVQGANGQVYDAALAAQLAAQGRDPRGRVGLLSRLSPRMSPETSARLGNAAFYAAAVGGGFATDQLRPTQTADVAAQAGPANQREFVNRSALANGAQLGLTGAIAGSAFGPWGTAIGGAVGATVGFVSAIKESEQEIRRAKIGNALTTWGTASGTSPPAGPGSTGRPPPRGWRPSGRRAASLFEKARADATGTSAGSTPQRSAPSTSPTSASNSAPTSGTTTPPSTGSPRTWASPARRPASQSTTSPRKSSRGAGGSTSPSWR
jgi:TP901 family phage tail tape measure protein